MRPWFVLALVAGGCVPDPYFGETWIAPFDGQTGVDPGFVPVVSVNLDLPPDWELDPDTIVVADADGGERVPGRVELAWPGLQFVPDDPFAPGHTFLWSVSAPSEQFRGPTVAFPPLLEGVAVFSTRSELAVVDAWVRRENGHPCVLLSRAAEPGEYADLRLTVDGEERGATWGPVEGVWDPGAVYREPESTIACATGTTVDVGRQVRLALDDRAWTWIIEAGSAGGALREHRRYAPAEEN